MVCVVGRMRDLILQLSKSSIYSTKPTHGYVDSHIIDQALRLRLKNETSVILSDLYLQILQYIEMHKTTLTDIIINDRESVLS
ncbi:protein involved in biofilm formation [Escherichia coli]|nr:protein involved in biofilm formation [Escherichia coli]CAD5567327.1 protein involved in biofilm formation [Escherichia coli]